MEVAPGTLLGPYRIVAPIGAGGMGTVYRVHDARLGRDVAVKVSREQFTERFGREARAIAALNHTNVCHLYDVGPNYLVMELVEGEPLRGPLPLDEAFPILRQLIDGIEAAHEKGITHRDLKPANIRITPDGVVKILDFGERQMMAVDVTSGETLDVGTPRALFQMPDSDTWDVTRDGQRFLFRLPVGGATTPPYQVILNWQTGLTPAD